MRRLAILLLCAFSLSAFAADHTPPTREESFGDVTVYYNAFASSMLQPAVAKAAGLTRSKGLNLLNVTVLKNGKPLPANVSGSYKALAGTSNPLAFRQVADHGSISYIAEVPVNQADTYTFNISVKAGSDDSHSFSYDQQLYPGT
jgi:hypothetical protein